MKAYILSSAVPLILILVFALTLISFADQSETAILHEKTTDMIAYIDSEADEIQDLIAIDKDWKTYDYKRLIAHAAEYYDKRPMTYAAAFDSDLDLISVRHESITGVPYNPWKDKEFTKAIAAAFPTEKARAEKRKPYGEMKLWFPASEEKKDEPDRWMHLYFRWIPDNVDRPFLFVAAISEYTVSNHVKDVFYTRLIIIAILSALFSIIASIVQRRQLFQGSSDYKRISERYHE